MSTSGRKLQAVLCQPVLDTYESRHSSAGAAEGRAWRDVRCHRLTRQRGETYRVSVSDHRPGPAWHVLAIKNWHTAGRFGGGGLAAPSLSRPPPAPPCSPGFPTARVTRAGLLPAAERCQHCQTVCQTAPLIEDLALTSLTSQPRAAPCSPAQPRAAPPATSDADWRGPGPSLDACYCSEPQ